MRGLPALLFLVALQSSPVLAQTGNHPWEKDQQLIEATMARVQKSGVLALQNDLPALEGALAGAKHSIELGAEGEGGTNYVLTDGGPDTLAQLAQASLASRRGRTLAVANPYPVIAFYLGSYYDEVDKPAEALRALDAGLALFPFELGKTRPSLLLERGAALNHLKRPQEALSSYEAMLAILDQSDELRAVALRGRGFALTELGRLDEAEVAYRDSLKLKPENAVALAELKYIAGLKSGRAKSEPTMTKVQPSNIGN